MRLYLAGAVRYDSIWHSRPVLHQSILCDSTTAPGAALSATTSRLLILALGDAIWYGRVSDKLYYDPNRFQTNGAAPRAPASRRASARAPRNRLRPLKPESLSNHSISLRAALLYSEDTRVAQKRAIVAAGLRRLPASRALDQKRFGSHHQTSSREKSRLVKAYPAPLLEFWILDCKMLRDQVGHNTLSPSQQDSRGFASCVICSPCQLASPAEMRVEMTKLVNPMLAASATATILRWVVRSAP